jgi:3' exoribonuclease, RNase T-like
VTTTSEDELPDEESAAPPVRSDVYISADIESDGPVPGRYSMLSLGMCIAGEQDAAGTFRPIQPESARFYRELRPISDEYEQGALDAIRDSGIDRDRLKVEGADPVVAMTEAARWVNDLADGRRPVFVGWPMGYDWMFLQWYFHTFSEVGSPFAFGSALDMKTMVYAATHQVLDLLGKEKLPAELVPDRPHTHHALDDAVEQAELFQNLRRWRFPGADR